MPPLTRTFQIPVTATGKEEETIPIHLHEPSLISDNLGLKTWAASYLLAKRLASLSSSLPSSHHPPPQQQQQHQQDARPPPRPRVLELGAGTGLVGIAAAAVWGAAVHLTDLPAIEPNLAANVNANRETIERRGGGGATTGVLDWSDQDGSPRSDNEEERYPVILAADPLYSPEHPRMLAQTIVAWLRKGPDARVVVELPVRDAYVPEVEEFRARMDESGLRILEEGEEVGFDDWASRVEGDSSEVRCWWGMWGWAEIESVPTS
ncbi:MAG: hypothetical protein M1837_002095 [Sclerophora amabilis]|nr:MAG: hypothetical protein M1837_002095 [Sclerophora amabilis]